MRDGGYASQKLLRIWWLKPDRLVFAFILPLLWVFFLLSGHLLAERNVADFFTFGACIALSALLVAYAIGAFFSYKLRVPAIAVRSISERWFHFFFILTFAAYIIWFIPIFRNFGVVLAIAAGTPDSVYLARNMLATMPGITTFTQADIAFVCLLSMRMIDGFSIPKIIKREAILIFLLAAFRTLVMSERLALIEVAVPMIPAVLVHMRGKLIRYFKVLNLAPFLGIFMLIVFFGVTEYFRSWVNFYSMRDTSFTDFIINRIATYYIYAINTGLGAVDRFYSHYNFPCYSFYWLLRMPVVGESIDKFFHVYNPTKQVLSAYADPQFNNVSGLVALVWDFGWVGSLFVCSISGIVTGLAWKSLACGRGALRYFYPILYVGLLDLLREPYLGQGRSFVPIVLLLIMVLVNSKTRDMHLAPIT